jgi:two-component system sensor histidine kinase CreC
MSLHLRILLSYALVISLAVYLFIQGAAKELKPGVRQATEQSLVNMAHLLAELVARELAQGEINHGHFRQALDAFQRRHFNAQIWHLRYDRPDLRIYITDRQGRVVFDSSGEAVGADYSRWNDVYLTLQGRYGARSTLSDPANKHSSVMHVAAPVFHEGELVGVLSVSRPNLSLQPYVDFARSRVQLLGVALLLAALAISVLISFWITRSIRRLTRYADAVSAGQTTQAPQLAEAELARLSQAMASMRSELEGKAYVERYVHTLTHELKSPLTAIAAASEIIADHPGKETSSRFAASISREVQRIQQLVERLLNLAGVEKRTEPVERQRLVLGELLSDALQGKEAPMAERELHWQDQSNPQQPLHGEPFLLRQALSNLIDNAIDFSPQGGVIRCRSQVTDGLLVIRIEDQGPGVPDYALPRVSERFYSLPRPHGGDKSTGLGLSLVSEVARLHRGRFQLENTAQGARASLYLPVD